MSVPANRDVVRATVRVSLVFTDSSSFCGCVWKRGRKEQSFLSRASRFARSSLNRRCRSRSKVAALVATSLPRGAGLAERALVAMRGVKEQPAISRLRAASLSLTRFARISAPLLCNLVEASTPRRAGEAE